MTAPSPEAPPEAVPGARADRPRLHVALLVAIGLVGLVRGAFWVAVTPVFNPIDEGAHYAYVESMARRARPPVVGSDRLSADALGLVKSVRTSEWRSAPVPPSPDDDRWGAVRESYEGVQGPAYYALMAVPYRLARPFGVLTSVYAVRLATVVLSLLAVPVAYLLARELFPRRREAWLAAPAMLVVLQGFNGNLGSITNDALVVPLAGATLLAAARAARRGLTGRSALVAGLLVGLGLATKSNLLALVPVVALAVAGAAVARRERWVRVARWGLYAAPAVALGVLPWLLWNLVQYGAVSASEEVDLITGPAQPDFPFSPEGLRLHLVWGSIGFWDFQLVARPLGRYMWVLSILAGALLVAGVVASLARRRQWDAAALTWLASSWFLTMLTMLVVIYGVFGGHSSVIGRHLYPSLVAVVVLVATAAFVVAGRLGGSIVLVVVACLALSFEQPLVHAFVDRWYTDGAVGRLVPAVEQSYGEGVVGVGSARLSAPCPAAAVAFAFVGPAPSSLRVTTGAGVVDAPRRAHLAGLVQPWDVYRLPDPAPAGDRLDVALAGAAVSASATDREPRFSLPGEPGDPVARVYCASDDPDGERFDALFAPDHPGWIGHGHVRGWPVAWSWAARAALVAVLAMAVAARRALHVSGPGRGLR